MIKLALCPFIKYTHTPIYISIAKIFLRKDITLACYRYMRRVKASLYCVSINRSFKTLLYRNCTKPKSISVSLILLLSAKRMNINHIELIGNIIYLLAKIVVYIIILLPPTPPTPSLHPALPPLSPPPTSAPPSLLVIHYHYRHYHHYHHHYYHHHYHYYNPPTTTTITTTTITTTTTTTGIITHPLPPLSPLSSSLLPPPLPSL